MNDCTVEVCIGKVNGCDLVLRHAYKNGKPQDMYVAHHKIDHAKILVCGWIRQSIPYLVNLWEGV